MPSSSVIAIDRNLCPLCGQPNRCAMELARDNGAAPQPCWCTQVDFGADLLAEVPAALKDRTCICPSCARGAAQA